MAAVFRGLSCGSSLRNLCLFHRSVKAREDSVHYVGSLPKRLAFWQRELKWVLCAPIWPSGVPGFGSGI